MPFPAEVFPMPQADPERRRRYYQDWYARNREKHNKRRRERYANDAEYREKVKAVTEAYRAKLSQTDYGDPWNDYVLDEYNQVMYKTSAVARIVGRSVSTLRLWEGREWIPPVTDYPGEHRFYSPGQVGLIKRLATYLSSHPGAKDTDTQFQHLLEYINFHWST